MDSVRQEGANEMEEKYVTHYKGKEIEIPKEVLDDLYNKQVKSTGWANFNELNTYFYISGKGNVTLAETKKTNRLEADIRNFNIFSSKELAENIMRFEVLNRKIVKRISEICEPVDWEKSSKYIIYYNYEHKCLDYSLYYVCRYSGWVCDTAYHARQIINEFRDELVWYFTEFKTRMDG